MRAMFVKLIKRMFLMQALWLEAKLSSNFLKSGPNGNKNTENEPNSSLPAAYYTKRQVTLLSALMQKTCIAILHVFA